MEKNKKIILGVIVSIIIIGIASFIVYMEFGGYYHNNGMYKEEFETGKKIATISDIDNYNLETLGMYLTNKFNQPFKESYETVDYYIFYYFYGDTIEGNISDIYRNTLLSPIFNYYNIDNKTNLSNSDIPGRNTEYASHHNIILATIPSKYHNDYNDAYIDSISIIIEKKTGEVSINSIMFH